MVVCFTDCKYPQMVAWWESVSTLNGNCSILILIKLRPVITWEPLGTGRVRSGAFSKEHSGRGKGASGAYLMEAGGGSANGWKT
jgi:hypothetical protein